ncbi:MAG: hypothetical protein GWP10_07245, partial [Nitrospiraceae bacterium]|nr:hypothetical protein [Nitrospiraceae bacterium]
MFDKKTTGKSNMFGGWERFKVEPVHIQQPSPVIEKKESFWDKRKNSFTQFTKDLKTVGSFADQKIKESGIGRDVGIVSRFAKSKFGETQIGKDVDIVKRGFEASKFNYTNYTNKLPFFEPVSRIGQSFKGGVMGTLESTGRGFEWLGFDSLKPFNDKVNDWQKSIEVENPNYIEEFYSGMGSMSLFYAPGLGVAKGASLISKVSPRIALLFGGAAMTAFEAMTEAGSAWQETKDLGLSEKEADKRAEKVFWANAVLVGITNKMGLFGEHKNGLLKKLLMTSSMEG